MKDHSTQINAASYMRDSESLWLWYEGLDDKSKEFKSHGGEWSVNDVFHHLMVVESMLIAQVKDRLASGKVRLAEWKHRRNALFLVAALRIPKRYKAPAAVLKSIESAEFILEDWQKVRLDLIVLLKEFPTEHINGLVFKHPSAGPIKISDAIRFLYFHMRHHFSQLRSLAKRGGFVGF